MPARNIKGITIEIDGNTTQLQDSLKDVNRDLKSTQDALRDVNKLLKLDPGNVDLIKQKQELLKTAIDQTKDRLEKEKTALEQLRNSPDMANHTQEMQALERQIADDELALKNLKGEAKDFGSVFKQEMEAAGDKMQELGGKISDVGDNMTKYVSGPVLAAGGAAIAAFTDVDSAMDELIKMTGATGDSFEDLKGVVEDIATTIPTDMQTAAAAVGEVNTRFGATGEELEALSGKYVKFAELNNTDVVGAIDTTQQAMAAWGISAEDAGAFLDTLTKASQDTGASATSLADVVADNKAVFDEMGFSVSDAVGFLANLEKNGIDSGTAMAGLKKGLQNASKEGISMQAALFKMNHSLQNAGSSTEAMNDVMELFGNKAGPALAAALQEGRISFDALGTSINDNLGTIDETFEATLDPIDKTKTIFNELKITGAEVGGTIMEMLAPALETVANAIKGVKEWWDGLSPGMQQAIITIGGIIAAIGPLISVMGGIISAIGTVTTMIGLLSGPIGIVVAAIAAAVAVGVLLYKNWDTICEWAGNVKERVVEAWENIKSGVSSAAENVKEKVSTAWNTMTSAVSEKMSAMKEMVSGKLDAVKQAYQNAGGGIKGVVSGMMEGVKQYFSLGFDTINTLTGGKLNAVKEKFQSILTSAKNIVSGVIDKIKSLFNFSWSLPKLKLPHFSITGKFSLSPPSVPKLSVSWYKKAYDNPVMFTSPTVLQTPQGLKGFGDGVGAEIVIGQNKLMSMIAQASGRGSGPVNISIYPTASQNAKEIAQEVSSILYGQYQATGY